MLPATTTRVESHTSDEANARIARRTDHNIRNYTLAGPAAIDRRLRELDEEWDVERALEANASSLILTSVVLGATVDRKFLYVPAVISAFLLQHALQGWCPPLPLLRRLGFRTSREIEHERRALLVRRAASNSPG